MPATITHKFISGIADDPDPSLVRPSNWDELHDVTLNVDLTSEVNGVLPAANGGFSNEAVDDRVAALIQNGTGINWVYDDISNTLTGTVSLSSFSTTNLAEGLNLYYTDERVDDRVSSLIQNGTGLSWTYNDASGTLTGNVSLSSFSTTNLSEGSNLYFTDERAQDAVGAALANTASISLSYNDTGNQITANIAGGSTAINAIGEITNNGIFSAGFQLKKFINPPSFSTDQNNFFPSEGEVTLAQATNINLTATAKCSITGLAMQEPGDIKVLHNVGSFTIVLANQSTASSQANRFSLFSDYYLRPGESVIVIYDPTLARWRLAAPFRDTVYQTRTVTSSATVTLTDADSIIYCNSSSAINITLPKSTTESLPAGFSTKIINIGLGDVTVIREAGDIFETETTLIAQNAQMDVVLKTAGSPNTWQAFGGTRLIPWGYTYTVFDTAIASGNTFYINAGVDSSVVLTDVWFVCKSGTATSCTLIINGANVTSTGISISSTLSHAGLTAANSIPAGGYIQINFSGVTSLIQPMVSLRGYRRS